MSTTAAWVLAAVTALLAVLVLLLAVAVLRLRSRLGVLEADRFASSDTPRSSQGLRDDAVGSLDGDPATQTQYVITQVGEPVRPEVEPAPVVPGPVFADLLLKETVVQTASLFHGLRRAL